MSRRPAVEGWIQPYSRHQQERCPNCKELVPWPNPQGIEGVDVADDREPFGRLLSDTLRALGRRRVRVSIEVLDH